MKYVEGDIVVAICSGQNGYYDSSFPETGTVGEVVSVDTISNMVHVVWNDDCYRKTSCKEYQIKLAGEYFSKEG